MQAEAFATILTSVFLLFIILGLLFGWWRGYAKSIIRLGFVIGVAVLTFFVVPSISKAILTLDISGLGVVINGSTATTVQELIVILLESIPYVQDLMLASPSFEAIFVLLPEVLLNIVGFILFFYLFRLISLIIYWIIGAIAFPKKKQVGKNKHRMIGAIIGGVQGAIIAIVLLLPVYGIINTVSPVIKGETIASSNTQLVQEYVTAEGDDSTKAVFKSAFTTSEEYVVAIENSFLTKMFNTIGVTKLADVTFEKLTTVTYDETEFNLKKEVKILNNAYQQVTFIKDEKIDFKNPEHVEQVDKAVDVLLTSENMADIVEELVVGLAQGWTNPEDPTFIGIRKPDLGNPDFNNALDAILKELADERGNDVKQDITSIMDAYVILAKSDILTSSDAIATLKLDKNEYLVTNVLNEFVKSPTMKDCLPEVLNCALKYGFKQIGFTDAQIEYIGDINTDAVIGNAEIARLEIVADEVVIIYDQMNNAPADAELYEKVNFESLGKTFANLRDLDLMKKDNGDGTYDYSTSGRIVECILENEKFVGEGNVDKFAGLSDQLVGNPDKDIVGIWNKPDADLAATFKGFGDAMKIADKMSTPSADSKVTSDDVKDLLDTFSGNDSMKDVITEVVNEEFLTGEDGLGLDSETASVITDVVDKVVNDPDFDSEKETDAAVEIFNTANKIKETPVGETTLEDDEQNSLIAALVKSESLTSMLAENAEATGEEKNETLDLAANLHEDTRADIIEKINEQAEAGKISADKKEQLLKIFGSNN